MFAFHCRDDNEGPIVAALIAIGAVVCKIQGLPGDAGVPDLIVGFRGVTKLLEVKRPGTAQQSARSSRTKRAKGNDGPPENAKGQLTPTQVTWWSEWTGGEAYVVETPEEAVRLVRGEDLPPYLVVTSGIDEHGPIVALSSANQHPPHTWLSPGAADALAGALHEQAGVARGMAAEAARQTANRKEKT